LVGTSVQVYRTSATEDLAKLAPVSLQGWSFSATLPAYSVTTFVVPLQSAPL
jgi:O-glycosyl hydrolase